MSCKKRTHRTQPYEVQKISLDNSNGRIRRKPPKFCPDCNHDCVDSKLNRIEELVDNFPKTFPKKDSNKFLYSM